MSIKTHYATQLAPQGELSEHSEHLRLAGNSARQTVGKCWARRWVACWLCLVGISCLFCEWSHEPFTNFADTSRKRINQSVSEGVRPYWQASSTNHVSGRAKDIEFFCPTKNAYLHAKFCNSQVPTNVVQNEQGGNGQGAFAAYDAAECCTQVRSIKKTTKANSKLIVEEMITRSSSADYANC